MPVLACGCVCALERLERLSMTFTAKIELLVCDFSRLYNLGKLFAFTVIKGFFSYFSTGFI